VLKGAVLRKPGIISLLAMALFAELGVAVLNVSAMPVYLTAPDGRGFKTGWLGLVMTVFLLSEAMLKWFFGHLADKHGRLIFLISAPLLWTITPLLILAIPYSWGLMAIPIITILSLVNGMAAAMLWPSLYAAVAESVDETQKGEALSLLNVCFMLGLALGLPIGGVVNSVARSLDASFYLASALFLCTAVTAMIIGPKLSCLSRPDHAEHGEPNLKEMWTCARAMPSVLGTAFVTFLGVGFPMTIIKLFALQQYGLTEAKFGSLTLPAALAMAVFSVPLGRRGEKLGRQRAVRIGLWLCAVGVWSVAVGGWIAAFRNPAVLAVGGVLVGIGFLLALPAWYASVSAMNPSRSGSYLGTVMAVQGIGAIVGIAVGSYLFQIDGYLPFLGCAIAVTTGALMSMFTLPSPPSRIQSDESARF